VPCGPKLRLLSELSFVNPPCCCFGDATGEKASYMLFLLALLFEKGSTTFLRVGLLVKVGFLLGVFCCTGVFCCMGDLTGDLTGDLNGDLIGDYLPDLPQESF